ncbi:MAG TPA: ABC transporter substrate-binding protein [Candidatus Kryptonia bacterium]|nr:ABC transporter substrate-binding protein [Candidatus Kryptonia bacterium]
MRRALCLLLLLLGCTGSQPAALPAEYFRLAGVDDVPTLDPAVGYDTTSWFFEQMLFNTLLDYDDDGQLVPELARTWDASADGRTFTFELRDDVRFSNGRPLIAADVKFSLERVLRPQTRSQGIEFFSDIAGAQEFIAGSASEVSGLRVLGEHTLGVELERFDPLWLHKLALQFAAVVPREEVERWGEDFASHPVGSGPFVLREWTRGQRLLLERNAHYFVSGRPKLAGVVRAVGLNDQLAWFRYEAGELDNLLTIPAAEFPRVVRSPAYAPLLKKETSLRTQYLGLNCEVPPFTDRRVRQAVSHAINKTKLLRLINNRGVVARSILPPNMPGADPDDASVPRYDFDPARARALLAEAGYANGFQTTLWVRSDEDGRRLAQSIQQDLADIGVHAEIRPIAWGPFLQAVRTPGLVPMFQLGWEADFPDPSNFLEVLFHSKNRGSNNDTFYSNAVVDGVLDRAAVTIDARARLELLRRAERLIMADSPWVPLYHPVAYQVVSPRVRDFRLHPLRPARVEEVWLAADGAAPPAEAAQSRPDPSAS